LPCLPSSYNSPSSPSTYAYRIAYCLAISFSLNSAASGGEGGTAAGGGSGLASCKRSHSATTLRRASSVSGRSYAVSWPPSWTHLDQTF
jgi:hypothetical protein